MATNKNRVNAYIDDKAFKAFDLFCQEWQVSYSRGVELLIHKYLLGDLSGAESPLDLTPTQLEEITAKVKSNLDEVISNAVKTKIEEVKSNLDSAISNVLVEKLPLDKFNKVIALGDEYDALLGK